jgi:hypothetical protein
MDGLPVQTLFNPTVGLDDLGRNIIRCLGPTPIPGFKDQELRF